jgi:hypothetical protein
VCWRDARSWARFVAIATAVIVVISMAACGDGDSGESGSSGNAAETSDVSGETQSVGGSDEEQIKQAVTVFQKAGIEGDAKTVCASFTSAYRKSVVRQANGEPCVKSFKELLSNRVEDQKTPRVTAVKMTGEDKAKVAYKGGPVAGSIRVVREDGDWKMDLGAIETKVAGPGPQPKGLE